MKWGNRTRNFWITALVIVWTLAFHYESVRFFYLNPLFKRELPKVKFLFPPAGWIMFFHVDETYTMAEVYGVKNGEPQLIDPHRIFETKAIGYDNIHRNVLSSVLYPQRKEDFCRFLRRKFPDYESFLVPVVHYPAVVKEPTKKLYRVMYQCQ